MIKWPWTRRRNRFPIIVGGCFRSGTSLVRRLLNAHSRIYCGPEVKFFRDLYGDYFQDPLGHLRFTNSARSIVDEDDLLDLLGSSFIAMHDRAAKRAGKARWADKNPENVLYLKQWRRLLGRDWLFIQVVRNPLDTLASIKEAGFPLTIPADTDDRISMYLRYTQAGLDYCAENPDTSYILGYEALVSDPKHTIEGLMGWLGEDFETGQLRFNQFNHQAGLEDPNVSTTSSVVSSGIGRWKSALTQLEVSLVQDRTNAFWTPLERRNGPVATLTGLFDDEA